MIRQQYDLGQKDSIVTDSTIIPLFYPRLRFEYTFQYNKYSYNFQDYVADSGYYNHNYGLSLASPVDTVELQDQWKEIINDFSIYQYPDAKNLHQFIKIGASHAEFVIKEFNRQEQFLSMYSVMLNTGTVQRTRNGILRQKGNCILPASMPEIIMLISVCNDLWEKNELCPARF